MIDRRPWFERWPDLLEWELARFTACGLPARVDEAAQAAGRIVIATEADYSGDTVELRVAYPSEYPELPPLVFAAPGLLDRHQHPISGNFCLLERPMDDWKAKDWGAADLIRVQLTRLLRDSEAGPEAVRAAEAPMPEPASAYFAYAGGASVLVPEELAEPPGDGGTLTLAEIRPGLLRVEAAGDKRALGLDDALPAGRRIKVRWRRIEEPPVGAPDAAGVLAWMRANQPGLLQPPLPPKLQPARRGAHAGPEIIALAFREEGPAVGDSRPAWLFVCRDRTPGRVGDYLFHSQVISPRELRRRTPDLEGLEAMRAVVIGGGSLGGDMAIEIAKAGIGALDIIDYDRLLAGNSVRHPLGIDYTGLQKAQAVALACRRANPFCVATAHEFRLGDVGWATGAAPIDLLAGLIENGDIVIDATGSHQVAQVAARLAAEAGVPFVGAWMTEAAWGAEVARIRSGTCCWTCFATRLRAGEFHTAEAGPPSMVAPQGCALPTTTGTGFDAAEAAAIATRLAVQTLAPAGGYPDAAWDFAAISFRRDPLDPEYPRFAATPLVPTKDCSQCLELAGSLATR